MANKRDVELLLRATDLTSKPFADVVSAVQKLTEKLTQQEAAASKGEATVRELSTTLNSLNEASRALASQNAAIERYRDLTTQLEKAQAKAADAAAAVTALKTAQEGGAQATAAQTRELNKAEAAVTRSVADVQKRTQALERQSDVLAKAGIDIAQLAAAEQALVAAATETGQARARATTALEEYDSRLRSHRAEVKAAADAEKANAALLREAAEAEAELAARATAARDADLARRAAAEKAAADRAAKAAADYVRVWEAALAAVEAKAKEEADAREFRAKSAAAQAQVNAAAYERFWIDALNAVDAKAKEEGDILATRSKAAAAQAQVNARAYEKFWIDALNDVDRARKEEADVAAFREKLAAARAKEAASEYERFWIGALDEVEAKQKAANARLQEQSAAFRANRDAIRSAFQATIGYTAAQDALTKKQSGYSGKPGFLGLKPYELQNLSFQINDIITQLGSGASLTQALSQQGGQIFQIFQSRLTGFVAVLPQLAVVVAVLGTAIASLVRLSNTVQSVREFNAALTLSADGARYSGEEIVKIQRRLQALGLGFEEAGASLTKFVQAGIGTTKLQEFTLTAFKLSEVLKKDLKTVTDDLIQGFTGGFDALVKLDKQYNVFTATQLAAIQQAFEEKGAIEGRAQAFTILQQKADDAEKKLAGPVSRAFRTARAAWMEFLDAIANSSAGQALFKVLVGGAQVLEKAANGLRDAVKAVSGEGGFEGAIAAERAELEKLERTRKQMTERNDRLKPDPSALQRVDEAIAARTLNIDNLQRAQGAAKVTAATTAQARATDELAVATEKAKKAGAQFLEDQQDQIDAAKGVNNARRIEIAGKKAYEAALAAGSDPDSAKTAKLRAEAAERAKIGRDGAKQAESLEQQLLNILAQGDKAQRESLQNRLAAIDISYDSALKKIQAFQKAGGAAIGGEPIEAFRQRIEAQREIVKQNETIKFFEQNIGDLAKARATVYKDINDAVASGNMTAAAGFAAAQAAADDINPKIKALANDALTFAKAMQEARPGPQITSFIAQMQRAAGQAGDGARTGLGGAAEGLAKAQFTEINAKLQERVEIERAWQNLVEKGVVTQTEASAAIRSSYEEINVALEDMVKGFEDFLAVAGDALPAGALELFRAKIAGVRADMKELDPVARRLQVTIENGIANNAVNALDAVAEAIGGAVANTMSWAEAWTAVGKATAMFFADLFRDIAKAILQAQILALVKSAFGGSTLFHAGGVVGSGGMTRTGQSGSWFGAPRYHSGQAAVGMSANEVKATLLKGEEVLTRDDPRNVLNGAKNYRGGQGAAPNAGIRQVLVLDEKQVPAAMQSPTGERVVLTHIKANAPAIRNILGL